MTINKMTKQTFKKKEDAGSFEYQFEDLSKVDRKGKPITLRKPAQKRQINMDREILSFIVANIDAYCGEEGRVSAIDFTRQQNTWWSHPVEGRALGLAASNGRLVVCTDRGYIYCFANTNQENQSHKEPAKREAVIPEVIQSVAKEIISKSAIAEGWCVDIGAGNGDLAIALARRTKLNICCLVEDVARADAIRKQLQILGLLGARVSVHVGGLSQSPFPDQFANLIVSSASMEGQLSAAVKKKSPGCKGLLEVRPVGVKLMICIWKHVVHWKAPEVGHIKTPMQPIRSAQMMP